MAEVYEWGTDKLLGTTGPNEFSEYLEEINYGCGPNYEGFVNGEAYGFPGKVIYIEGYWLESDIKKREMRLTED